MGTKVVRTALPAGLQVPAGGVLPQIHLFKDDGFQGDELDLFGGGTDAIDNVAGGWNDQASSAIVVSGTWQLFFDSGFGGRSVTLTPGVYGSLESAGLGQPAGSTANPPAPGFNDQLSSLKPIGF